MYYYAKFFRVHVWNKRQIICKVGFQFLIMFNALIYHNHDILPHQLAKPCGIPAVCLFSFIWNSKGEDGASFLTMVHVHRAISSYSYSSSGVFKREDETYGLPVRAQEHEVNIHLPFASSVAIDTKKINRIIETNSGFPFTFLVFVFICSFLTPDETWYGVFILSKRYWSLAAMNTLYCSYTTGFWTPWLIRRWA